MVSPPLARRFPDLRGRRVLVIGLGRSGLAATRLAVEQGAVVSVTDSGTGQRVETAAAEARKLGASVITGSQSPDLVEQADLVVVSPGVPPGIELLEAASRRELPIWGEVELAARFCRGRVIGVTGSNGKSTVTSMVGAILRHAGFGGGTGGNLATPFAELLQLDGPDAVHSVELSSFQLETVHALEPRVAMILNLSPDHLDRYPSFEAYGRAKARLLEVQADDDFAILNADDSASEVFRRFVRGRLHLFSCRQEVEPGAFVRNSRMVLRTDAGEESLLSVSELPLPGDHNLANALAAALACRLVGCDTQAIAEALRHFEGLPHRLEHVRSLGGVDYYNDSKATNPASTAQALRAFGEGRVHLILGGRDKGVEWSELEPLIRLHARRVLLVGEAAAELERRFVGTAELSVAGTVPEAVAVAFEVASPGDVVLLAPGCASFDQYRNFEERGDDFRSAVMALPAEGASDA